MASVLVQSSEPRRVFKRGGNWNNAGIDGLFASNVNNASSDANANNGSRLLLSNIARCVISPQLLLKNSLREKA